MADLRFRFIEDYAGGLLNISRQEISTTGEVLSQDGLTTEGTIFVEDGSGVKTGLKLGVSLAESVDPTTETGIVNVRFADRTYAKVRDLRIFTTAIASAQSALSEATSTSISNLETAFQLLEDDVSTLEENLQGNITSQREKIQELTINQNSLIERVDTHDVDLENISSRVTFLESSAGNINGEAPNDFSSGLLLSSLGGVVNANKTVLREYLYTPAIGDFRETTPGIGERVDAAPLQVGVGAVFAISDLRTDPAALEFYKTRGSTLYSQGACRKGDAIGAFHFSGSNGTESVLGASIYCNIGKTWSATENLAENSVYFRYRYAVPGNTSVQDRFFIGEPIDDNDAVGPKTIRIVNPEGTAESANVAFDAYNRLIKISSSLKYKTQIEDLEDQYVFKALDELRPVWYRSTTSADNHNWSWYGLIAEEVAEVDPRLVHWGYAEDQYELVEDGKNQYKRELKKNATLTPEGIQYDRIGVLLLKIVKQQQQRIDELEQTIKSLIPVEE